ncbi:SWFGD domain-containing protein [Sphingomonas antarctica]|uniref:DUF2171 domain-containing protein n=1 Tax=Sphingomonas antarctica TaxID=2040274 RepID=UPI0039EB33B8
MGYDRDDVRGSYGNEYGRRAPSYDDRSYAYGGQRDYPRQGGGYDRDRNFIERAGDEVRSWFGDDEAEQRRERDARYSGVDRGSYSNGGYGDRNRYDASRGYRDVNRSNGGNDGRPGGFMDRVSNWFDDGDRGRNEEHSDYHSWRSRQVQDLDRDYHEYRQENRQRFENEFGEFRNRRQTQRASLSQVKEHFEVLGSDGEHIGKVDKVRGDRIILAKNDPSAGGHHHSIPSSWLQSVDGERVTITKTADEAKRAWTDLDANSAMFGDSNTDRDRGAHVLNRSFSGTY